MVHSWGGLPRNICEIGADAEMFSQIWINTHSLLLPGVVKVGERGNMSLNYQKLMLPENQRKCIETKMVRSVTINREVHQWAERGIKLQPVLIKN